MNVELKEMPYNFSDCNAINYCDCGGYRNFEIIVDDYTVGHLYIDQQTATANGLQCETYLSWIEFLTIFRSKHLLRPVFNALYDMFGEFVFECDERLRSKYLAAGAKCLGEDEFTENYIFSYSN